MDKLNTTEINDVLKDVRSSYRLLALYQKRLLDIVKYCVNAYSASFDSGWSKFSIPPAANGKRANINSLSWDWLSMYLYEFNLGAIEVGEDKYNFKIVHQADSGYYDANADKSIHPGSIDQFGEVNKAVTRLFFVISKNDNGCPMQHIINGNLKTQDNSKLIKGNWLAVPYCLQRFSDQFDTDIVLNEFNVICKDTFGVNLISQNS